MAGRLRPHRRARFAALLAGAFIGSAAGVFGASLAPLPDPQPMVCRTVPELASPAAEPEFQALLGRPI